MSERKTAEIKFRVEPSAKARWQAAADAIEDGLSEFIRHCVEQSILQHELWAEQNARRSAPLELPTSRVSGFADFIEANEPTDFYGGPDFEAPGVADIAVPVAASGRCASCGDPKGWEAACEKCGVTLNRTAPEPPACNCRAWEFCSHKAYEDSVTR